MSDIKKYTDKLYSNLNNLRKEIIRINRLEEVERNQEIINLYNYFKTGIEDEDYLFDTDDDTIKKCLNVKDCIDKDIEFLKNKCKNENRCIKYVDNMHKKFNTLINGINNKAKKIIQDKYKVYDKPIKTIHTTNDKAPIYGIYDVLIGRKWLKNRVITSQEDEDNMEPYFLKLDELYDELKSLIQKSMNIVLNNQESMKIVSSKPEKIATFLLTPQIPEDEYIKVYNLVNKYKDMISKTPEKVSVLFNDMIKQYMEITDENLGLLFYLYMLILMSEADNDLDIDIFIENYKKVMLDISSDIFLDEDENDTFYTFDDISDECITIPKGTILYRGSEEDFKNVSWFATNPITASRYYTNNNRSQYTDLETWCENVKKLFIYRVKDDITLINLSNINSVRRISESIKDEKIKNIFDNSFTIKDDKLYRTSRVWDDIAISKWLRDNNYEGYVAGRINSFHSEIMFIKPEKHLEQVERREVKDLGFTYSSYPYNLVNTKISVFQTETEDLLDKIILKGEGDVYFKGKYSRTPLFYAANEKQIDILVSKGADVNQEDQDGKTPLFHKNDIKIIKKLVSKGANINHRDKKGKTPLFYCDEIYLVNIFLSQGADVNIADNKGKTFLFYLRGKYDYDIIKKLIKEKININHKDEDGKTALFDTGDEDKVKLLLKYGANVNVKDNEGKTPLFNVYNEEIAELLISKGADVNVKDNEGKTPLFNVYGRSLGRLLIDKGADVNEKDIYGKTAVDYYNKEMFPEFILEKYKITNKEEDYVPSEEIIEYIKQDRGMELSDNMIESFLSELISLSESTKTIGKIKVIKGIKKM